MIEDKNPQRTPLSELGEFKLIEHLTESAEDFAMTRTEKRTFKSILERSDLDKANVLFLNSEVKRIAQEKFDPQGFETRLD